jgi:hypothetical protein
MGETCDRPVVYRAVTRGPACYCIMLFCTSLPEDLFWVAVVVWVNAT